ncbi:Sir2 family NAD-dependent protein deacetylase [Arcanobacterium sp. S3PF19]|uniref:Sir2 family NAD-dependent protein deacetylase n=1 Tax=Arcanobacterium sp. S3PF19 TaxID=1219585 RepID=UPI00068AE504|nr:Sir2 family NAD-dependent protein deacetylase [Arcanobacterium sp. S3PF19]
MELLDADTQAKLNDLARFMRGRKTVLVTGAGMSTDSGIPDYRGKGNTGIPSVEYGQFVSDPVWQRWVWERNHRTWQTMLSLGPTAAHTAQRKLERAGLLTGIATQNVDGLDIKAGCKNVFEMHGSFRNVVCLDCGEVTDRAVLHKRLTAKNPHCLPDPNPAHVAVLAPADRQSALKSKFRTVGCARCGGLLKPDVVFFGQMLPQETMSRAMRAGAEADVVLAVGTSFAVGTPLYVVRQALGNAAVFALINLGPTACDGSADLRIDAGASPCMTYLADLLCQTPAEREEEDRK